MGKQTSQFFDSYIDSYGRKRYQLKSLEKYSREHNTNEQPGKKYFTHNTLPEIIKAAPIPAQRAKPNEAEKGGSCFCLVDSFVPNRQPKQSNTAGLRSSTSCRVC